MKNDFKTSIGFEFKNIVSNVLSIRMRYELIFKNLQIDKPMNRFLRISFWVKFKTNFSENLYFGSNNK